jgi:hypothetical protein
MVNNTVMNEVNYSLFTLLNPARSAGAALPQFNRVADFLTRFAPNKI